MYLTARRCFYIQKTLLQNNKKTVVMLANVFDITSCFRLSPPWGGRLFCRAGNAHFLLFQSTPSVGRATTSPCYRHSCPEISIHALRGEGDAVHYSHRYHDAISIHALRGEGDIVSVLYKVLGRISIHALRGEGDHGDRVPRIAGRAFQSTPSVGRATANIYPQSVPPQYFNPRPPWGGRPRQQTRL